MRLRPRVSIARLTSTIMSTTGNGDAALKSSMQKCPAIEVTTTQFAPANASRLVRRVNIAAWPALSLFVRFLSSVGVSAWAIVNSKAACLAANAAIKRR